ncbi:hypothetical protein J5N97_002840 [Dioscorea zingiberensis]|uniref:Glabrous enhancer-binding protein-like DBD domain-containing protein n=1 Tax=Dioscorea zingiberensis TaxID=325984 RepID=A0A9D5HPS9_9LILI|nr:hypothetical protein J5N97_002840 [Dioscorea zingiberensis]
MTARKSPRKRAAAPTKHMDAGAASRSAAPKKWTADDEIALLRGALAYREETGFLPKAQTMNSFFDSIKETISADLGPSQVYNKIRRLKALYFKRRNPGLTAYSRLVYELSSEVWGVNEKKDVKDVKDVEDVEDVEDDENDEDDEDAKDADEEENGSGAYPYLTAAMSAHWKDHPHLAVEFLKEGLKKIDPEKALELEEKFFRCYWGLELALNSIALDL